MYAEIPFARAIAIRGGDEALLYGVVDLRQAHHNCVDSLLHQCDSRRLGYTRKGWGRKRRIVLRGRAALSHSDARADDERAARALEHGADCLDGALVQLAALRKPRPVMPESGVDDGIGCGCSAAQAFQVLQIASMRLGADGLKRFCACIRPRQSKYDSRGHFLRKYFRATGGQSSAGTLDQPAYRIDQHGPSPYQHATGMNQIQILLAFRAAVLDRVQQLGVKGRHSRQLFSIVAIVLAFAGGQRRDLAWVGYDHLVAIALQQSADPGRVGPGFQRNPHPAAR
jgi:hypothetical protein